MIYLDNAATTRLSDAARAAMEPFLAEEYGNPSGIYRLAAKSRAAVDRARGQCADLIGAEPREIFFTSGGTEADNWALVSAFESFSEKGKHIVVSKIEHHAVLRVCEYLASRGAEVTYVDADRDGRVDAEAVRRAIRPDTILISVMAANNETGTIQPTAEIGALAKERGILFHTDAVQACGHISLDVKRMNIDLLSASAHKLHGPKGVGFLYIRRGVRLKGFLRGGAQERGRRAGTENVAGIVGFGAAARERRLNMKDEAAEVARKRDLLIERLEAEIPGAYLIGSRTERLPNNVNICIPGTEGESLLIGLDLRGVAASSGAACSMGAVEPSHVLLALGLPYEDACSSVRLTLSGFTTEEEIQAAADALREVAAELRRQRQHG